MDEYLIVTESTRHGVWDGTPNVFPTEAEALDWARTEPPPRAGYAWMIYRIAFKREASEILSTWPGISQSPA